MSNIELFLKCIRESSRIFDINLGVDNNGVSYCILNNAIKFKPDVDSIIIVNYGIRCNSYSDFLCTVCDILNKLREEDQ